LAKDIDNLSTDVPAADITLWRHLIDKIFGLKINSVSAMQNAILAMIDSVCLTVCLSHAGIMPKRLQLRWCILHWRIAPRL